MRKVATYHKPSSVSEKKVAYINIKPCGLQGFYFIYEDFTMDKIYECANNFNKLTKTKYAFTIVSKRKLKTIVLDFMKEDFRHASGMRYIDDITIENNPSKLVDAILNQSITDEMLEKSTKYTTAKRPEGGSVKERVAEFCYLEDYLDKSDFIRIFEVQNFGSWIEAEYFIEASNRQRQTTVYIFIRKRVENDNYVVVSFFEKAATYKGTAAYWMLKEKITEDRHTILYRNPNFDVKQLEESDTDD